MTVGFGVDCIFYEVGHPDLLHSFFQRCLIIQNLKVGALSIHC